MSNIGETIKKFALIVFFIGAVITCVCTVLYFQISVPISFVILICGLLGFGISAMFLYGFGELISKTIDIEISNRKIAETIQKIVKQKNTAADRAAEFLALTESDDDSE